MDSNNYNTNQDNNYSTLDGIIKEVKRDFQSMLAKRKELVLKLGNAFEAAVSDPESICEEIKNIMRDEIAAKLISARNIEIYCPDKWKRKTRPKNEKTSISCIQEGKHKTHQKQLQLTHKVLLWMKNLCQSHQLMIILKDIRNGMSKGYKNTMEN
ncbi:MAG: hypothetical protein WBL88_11410 [Nitrososphaeraceae archaeon]